MDRAAKDGSESADDAEEIDELEFEGRLGGFLSDRSAIYLRFYPDGALDGHVRQRKKPQLHGLKLLSTSRKRKLPSESEAAAGPDKDDADSRLCAYIQGRWLRRGDGHVCNFHAMRRLGHVDRHTLTCRAELLTDGRATGTWRLSGEKAKDTTTNGGEIDEEETETEDETVIENVFEWTRVEKASSGGEDDSSKVEMSSDPLAVYPLTPGTYHFRGFTAYHVPDTPQPRTKQSKKKKKAPPRDECFVTMELLPDGSLKGTSREVVYPQSCPIRGRWEVGKIRYVLEFKVREAVGYFKYSARVGEGDQLAVKGEAARTLKGKWRNIDDNDATTPGYAGGRGQFELICVHRSNSSGVKKEVTDDLTSSMEEEMEREIGASDDDDGLATSGQLMRVLTTGSYVLKGKAIDEDGYEYESQLDIRLLDDGTVHGTCQELVFHQVQRLQGNWTKTKIRYELEYTVKREVGHYWYDGSLDSEGLVIHGEWCNMELLLDDGRSEQKGSYRGEKGTFSYAIIEATRRWSHASHSDFPRAFRDRVRCILLCSQRTHVLPSALWSKIFAFCGYDWFHISCRM